MTIKKIIKTTCTWFLFLALVACSNTQGEVPSELNPVYVGHQEVTYTIHDLNLDVKKVKLKSNHPMSPIDKNGNIVVCSRQEDKTVLSLYNVTTKKYTKIKEIPSLYSMAYAYSDEQYVIFYEYRVVDGYQIADVQYWAYNIGTGRLQEIHLEYLKESNPDIEIGSFTRKGHELFFETIERGYDEAGYYTGDGVESIYLYNLETDYIQRLVLGRQPQIVGDSLYYVQHRDAGAVVLQYNFTDASLEWAPITDAVETITAHDNQLLWARKTTNKYYVQIYDTTTNQIETLYENSEPILIYGATFNQHYFAWQQSQVLYAKAVNNFVKLTTPASSVMVSSDFLSWVEVTHKNNTDKSAQEYTLYYVENV